MYPAAIQANGGNGGGTAGFCVGGGGSGGAIHLLAPTLNTGGTLSAVGGVSPGASGSGAQGRIRVEAFTRNITGSVNPMMLTATPFGLFLPPNPPSAVRVVSIAGVPVPSSPTGSFTMPDVTINSSTPVTVQIQARYVPLTATVKLHFFSETGPDLQIDVPSLTGTETESNATASVTLPSGFSRAFVRATWANQ